MSRLWDGVLAVLVALSLVMSAALLWQQPQFRDQPTTVQPGPPRKPGREVGTLIRPLLLLHFPGDRSIGLAPGQPLYRYAWEVIAPALRAVRFDRLADAPIPTDEEIAALRSTYAVEFTLPGSVPIHEWMLLWGAGRTSADTDGPSVTRVLLSLQEPAIAAVWTADGPRLIRFAVLNVLPERLYLVGLLNNPGPEWRALPARVAGIPIAAGTFVPDVASLPAFAAPEPLISARDTGQVAAPFFLDLSVVRTITEHDDALLFTDGQSGLRVYPWGAVEYQRAPAGGPETDAPSLVNALDRVAQYVHDRDVWPREAYVSGSTRLPGQRTVRFGQRLAGWPVFSPAPALELLFDGTTIVRYSRAAGPAVPVSGTAHIVPPEDALQAIAGVAGWRTVTAVELGYVLPRADIELPIPTAEDHVDHGSGDGRRRPLYMPVWRITMTGGLQLYVDAASGRLLGGEAP